MSEYKPFLEIKKIFYSWPLPYGLAPAVYEMLGELLDSSYFENNKLVEVGANDEFIELARARQRQFERSQGTIWKAIKRLFPTPSLPEKETNHEYGTARELEKNP